MPLVSGSAFGQSSVGVESTFEKRPAQPESAVRANSASGFLIGPPCPNGSAGRAGAAADPSLRARCLRHFPPNNPKQRRHSLLLPPLVRRLRFAALLVRLLVAVVLELFLTNRLLDFFRRQGG